MFKLFTVFVNVSAILILLLLDYANGGGVVVFLKKLCCRVLCFVVRTTKAEIDFNIPLLLSEGTFLVVILTILRRLKRTQSKDKIDDLLEKSREAIAQTDYFLEKWRERKMNSYLDEEPQKLDPYKLEVPILHMAIIDVIGERNQFERGDAADTICIYDSTILSMTSLLDDMSMLSDERETNFDERDTHFDETVTNFDERETNFDEIETHFDKRETNFDEKKPYERRRWEVTEKKFEEL